MPRENTDGRTLPFADWEGRSLQAQYVRWEAEVAIEKGCTILLALTSTDHGDSSKRLAFGSGISALKIARGV